MENLLGTEDGKNCTGPGLLSYSKGMPVAVLANQCTPLGIVNGTRAVMHSVVPDSNCKYLKSYRKMTSKTANGKNQQKS